MEHIVNFVVTMMKYILEIQIVSVYAMTKNNTELRYERLLRDFEALVKKLKRKQIQLMEVRAKLGISE
jgi:L-rhamnose isomerase